MIKLIFLIICFLPSLAYAQDVQITDVDDLPFGTWDTVDPQMTDSLCIYKTSGNNRYWITATGDGVAGAFEISNGGDSAEFTVRWAKVGANFKKLTAGVAKRYGGVNKSSPTCGGTNNAEIRVEFSDSDLSALPPGNYSGNLSLLIEPD